MMKRVILIASAALYVIAFVVLLLIGNLPVTWAICLGVAIMIFFYKSRMSLRRSIQMKAVVPNVADAEKELIEGGLYAIHSVKPEGKIQVAKVLRKDKKSIDNNLIGQHERYFLHLSLYGNVFDQVPQKSDLGSLNFVGDGNSFAIMHVPVMAVGFLSRSPQLIGTMPVTSEELQLIDYWEKDRGGYFTQL